MNNKKFDGGQLNASDKKLRKFYLNLLNFSIQSEALMGEYGEIHYYNKDHTPGYDHRIFSFARWGGNERLIIVSNFDQNKTYDLELAIPADLISLWDLNRSAYKITDQLGSGGSFEMKIENGVGKIHLAVAPLDSFILSIKE